MIFPITPLVNSVVILQSFIFVAIFPRATLDAYCSCYPGYRYCPSIAHIFSVSAYFHFVCLGICITLFCYGPFILRFFAILIMVSWYFEFDVFCFILFSVCCFFRGSPARQLHARSRACGLRHCRSMGSIAKTSQNRKKSRCFATSAFKGKRLQIA